jgi:hypothetical protein
LKKIDKAFQQSHSSRCLLSLGKGKPPHIQSRPTYGGSVDVRVFCFYGGIKREKPQCIAVFPLIQVVTLASSKQTLEGPTNLRSSKPLEVANPMTSLPRNFTTKQESIWYPEPRVADISCEGCREIQPYHRHALVVSVTDGSCERRKYLCTWCAESLSPNWVSISTTEVEP